jgi:hypothetical protein
MPVHHGRSRARGTRIAGLPITPSLAALILAVFDRVGGVANRVVIQLVAITGPSVTAAR